jgi:hypothetical protein
MSDTVNISASALKNPTAPSFLNAPADQASTVSADSAASASAATSFTTLGNIISAYTQTQFSDPVKPFVLGFVQPDGVTIGSQVSTFAQVHIPGDPIKPFVLDIVHPSFGT